MFAGLKTGSSVSEVLNKWLCFGVAIALGTYHYFADLIFDEIYITLTSGGLRALRYVAGHEIFSRHVTTLWIVPTIFCADYTWTLEDIKRIVQSQETLELQGQRLRLLSNSRPPFTIPPNLLPVRQPLAAFGTTHTRIERLETSGGIMVDDGLDLTPAEEEALTPILQQLQHLSVRISSAHTQDSERQRLREDEEEVAFLLQESVVWQERKNRLEREKKRLLPLLAQAAPSLKTGLDLADAHFDWISQEFKFSRLSVLSLSQVITTPHLDK
ncbi:uncharacterized protein N7518_006186 [Penicillium psychrosexuale]|uniref:uncharacterized protein n=1 Tax=Penicillium psychrosexuale TaxID=1002107 RepID=UPI0025458D8D|nr:uncharacterized protein N7518_006186 [Penicillium psychrosexuale]KAJ5789175.1 hypothetical protein N7518_006186 [Penicillium psychrosexuale]